MTNIITNMDVTTLSGFAVHLLASAVLGALIGLERQYTRHPAGILTNLLVCLGSFAFTAFSYLCFRQGVDLTRVAAGIVSGIGFLGAGVILRDGGNIRGLNTAATVWSSAAVGILCCINNLLYAAMVAAAIVFLHLVLHPLSQKLDKIRRYDKTASPDEEAVYRISVVCPEEQELEIRKNIMSVIKNEPNALLHTLETVNSHSDENNKKIRAYITTRTNDDSLIESMITKVSKNEGVISAGWKIDHD
ncbi:MAG: MgtC/SapB family protein [Eubacterium sp.]|nr:MgtC/SapB family protein [Eubacterium sp.]